MDWEICVPIVGMESTQHISALFYSAQFSKILALTIDADQYKMNMRDSHFILGSLAFLGRIDDALVIWHRDQKHLSISERALCRFVLGIGLVRVSRYGEGRVLLAENLNSLRSKSGHSSPEIDVLKFYAMQGIAFYRFFQCRYQSALFFAEKAWESAFEQNFTYGLALSSDLKGHALIKVGEVAQGINILESAAKIAKKIGNGGLLDNIISSIAYYRSTFGLNDGSAVAKQKAIIAALKGEDNFSLVSAKTELARQLTLIGDLDGAEKELNQAARLVLVSGNRRQKITVKHRLAYTHFLKGKNQESLRLLSEAEMELEPNFDLHHRLMIEGLRLKILKEKNSPDLKNAEKIVSALTAKTGVGIGRNILWRETSEGQPTMPGDDIIGDMKHLTRSGFPAPFAEIEKLVSANLLGFLPEIMPFELGARVVCLDLIPGELFIFDRGNVFRSSTRVSGLLKSLIVALARGGKQKPDLVETLWGFSYHSLRHDPMLYALINRLRRVMGDRNVWLESDGGVYAFAENVKIFFYEHTDLPLSIRKSHKIKDENQASKSEYESSETPLQSNINHRQMAILSTLDQQKYTNAAKCAEIYDVSKVTATRDLTELWKIGLIVRIGKGRAIRYGLAKSFEKSPL
jgi:hypothetical protein